MSKESIDREISRWVTQIEPLVAEEARTHSDAPSVERWRHGVDELLTLIDTSRSGPGR